MIWFMYLVCSVCHQTEEETIKRTSFLNQFNIFLLIPCTESFSIQRQFPIWELNFPLSFEFHSHSQRIFLILFFSFFILFSFSFSIQRVPFRFYCNRTPNYATHNSQIKRIVHFNAPNQKFFQWVIRLAYLLCFMRRYIIIIIIIKLLSAWLSIENESKHFYFETFDYSVRYQNQITYVYWNSCDQWTLNDIQRNFVQSAI